MILVMITTKNKNRSHDNDIGDDEVGPRMVSIGSLQRRQTAAGLKITRTTKKGQKYQQPKRDKNTNNQKMEGKY